VEVGAGAVLLKLEIVRVLLGQAVDEEAGHGAGYCGRVVGGLIVLGEVFGAGLELGLAEEGEALVELEYLGVSRAVAQVLAQADEAGFDLVHPLNGRKIPRRVG